MDIEELVIQAERVGKRTQLFDRVSTIRKENPHLPTYEVYDRAFNDVVKL